MMRLDIILLGLAVFFADQPSAMEQGCCGSKTVGSHSYTLVDGETAAEAWGCKSLCVYKMDGEPDSRYCFKSGNLPVSCTGDTRKIFITNDLTTEVNGTVYVRVFLSINFNVSRIDPIPYNIPPSSQVPITLPEGNPGVKILRITAAVGGTNCDPELAPYGSVFGVFPKITTLTFCEVLSSERPTGHGTCSAIPIVFEGDLTCNLKANNCDPGYRPSFSPHDPGTVDGAICPCTCVLFYE